MDDIYTEEDLISFAKFCISLSHIDHGRLVPETDKALVEKWKQEKLAEAF